jgi:hypothetical protein
MNITQEQLDAYTKALEGFLKMGYSERVAKFYANVSAGIVPGNIIEGDDAAKWREMLDKRQEDAGNAKGQ